MPLLEANELIKFRSYRDYTNVDSNKVHRVWQQKSFELYESLQPLSSLKGPVVCAGISMV